jgi:hypothetical protein
LTLGIQLSLINSQVVQSRGCFHYQIVIPSLAVAKDIMHNLAALDTADVMLNYDSLFGNFSVGLFFFGCYRCSIREEEL